MDIVRVQELTKRYETNLAAVDNLDLGIAEGELLTLLGPSGCGKTTTLRCIAGLERPDAGDIELGGTAVVSTRRGIFVPPEKRQCGMVFQSYALWPHMSVFSNVAYPLKRAGGVDRSGIRKRVEHMLDSLGLGGYGKRFPSQLSGGQQQRVALARALISQPRLVLLDEPLSNLDAKLRSQMRIELRNLHEEFGTTMVYVTHDQTEAMVLSDRVVVMESGRVQQVGSPHEIYTRPVNRFVADFVGFENLFDAEVVESGRDSFVARLAGDGPRLRCASSAPPAVGDGVVLGARGSAFTVSPQELGAENTFPAVIDKAAYLGHTVEYHVRAGQVLFVVNVPETEFGNSNGERHVAPGDTLHVSVSPERLIHGLTPAT